MHKIDFTKLVASGNDFIVVGPLARSCLPEQVSVPVGPFKRLALKICDRKYGIGADGFLLLEKSKKADIKMRIFNPDGSEPDMCGNGARCVALWANSKLKTQNSKLKIETKAGIIKSEVNGNSVKINLTDPKGIKLNLPIKLNYRTLQVNFINTGVPHTVIFVEGLDKIDVVNLGRQIRYHKRFAPAGTNVDFVEVLSNKAIKIRTYERGVEDETLACGTGAAASALITDYGLPITDYGKINVQTKSGEILRVYFKKVNNTFKDVWLEGRAKIVCQGEYYV